jgi:hypothetical protein
VRMVSRDKGLNVVAQLTGMGINEQLCAVHLLSQPLVCCATLTLSTGRSRLF